MMESSHSIVAGSKMLDTSRVSKKLRYFRSDFDYDASESRSFLSKTLDRHGRMIIHDRNHMRNMFC